MIRTRRRRPSIWYNSGSVTLPRGGRTTGVFFFVARASFRKNLAYVGAHMANNAGSFLFGLIYIALWHAAARGRTLGPFHAHELVNYIALSQAVLWVSVFLPSGLDMAQQIRTGSVAMEMARPVPYVPRMLAAGVGEAFYNLVFRSGPLVVAFTLLGVFPWAAFAMGKGLMVAVALVMAVLTGVLFQYLIGLSAFWTVETRWARRLFLGLSVFMSGQLLPIPLMPHGLEQVLTWSPFQTLVSLPVSTWLGAERPSAWVAGALWVLLLYLGAYGLTRRAQRRLEVQGG